MTVWFTSDQHFGHANIIGYCDRPFVDVDEMNEAMITRWNAVVAPADIVWVLGDVALGPIDDSLGMVGHLRGRKRLLAGNHDRCWAGHGRPIDAWIARYLDAGFDEVHQGEITVEVSGIRVLACHFPYRGDSHDDDRFVPYRPVDHGDWLLHGHVHERWRQQDHMINVGVDVWDFTPVSEAEIARLITG